MGFFEKVINKITNRNILYYPGCLTKFVLPDVQMKYEKVLADIGVDFITLKEDEVCCGSPVLRAGYRKEFEELKEKNLKLFNAHGIGKIITNCPACAHMLKEEYGLKAEHISQTLKEYKRKLNKKDFEGEEISYHDPCHLGRYSNIYEEPREILKHQNINVIELKDNKEKSMCCGAGGGLRNNFKEVADKIAKKRINQTATAKLITPCPMCYLHLKQNSNGKEVMEFSEVL